MFCPSAFARHATPQDDDLIARDAIVHEVRIRRDDKAADAGAARGVSCGGIRKKERWDGAQSVANMLRPCGDCLAM
jgi:hypothetical protein